MRTETLNITALLVSLIASVTLLCSCTKMKVRRTHNLLLIIVLSFGINHLAYASDHYEAESAELEDAHIENIEIGHTGTGYAWCRHRGSLSWNINVANDGVYELNFRYALTRGKHKLNIYVDNILVQRKQSFRHTDSWSSWGDSKLRVFLSAGPHTVKIHNRWYNHFLVDSLTVSELALAQPGTNVGDNTLYEAEEALLNRVKIKDKKAGYTGTGYVKFRKYAYADFAIETLLPGEYDFKFRYMLRKKHWRLAIFVDGILDQIAQPPKTAHNVWAEFTLNHDYTFSSGVHSIKIVSLKGGGGKLDSLTLIPINVITDRDGDGVPDDQDAFPDDPAEWADLDNDGIGDNADLDRDGDGISNAYEELLGTNPNDPFSVPSDLDKDGIPDVLDDDRDGDGYLNDVDVFPDNPFDWSDIDGDGTGDNVDLDRDGDGISNDYEVLAGFDPNDPTSTPPDFDGDGIPDSLDDDRDGDGVLNINDVFPDDPAESADLDGDGIGDNADLDRDGDGISNAYEIQLGFDPNDPASTPPDLDGDGTPDSLDDDRDGDGVLNIDDAFPDNPAESSDLDGDGIGDNADLDRDGDGISNAYEIQLGFDPDNAASVPFDFDGDGIPDVIDLDRDGDGFLNINDIFPDDPTEWADLDSDGIGDNADLDRDGDGISNDFETQAGTDPNNPASTPPDQDGDGIPDSLDSDRDGDGVANVVDAFPDNAAESSDIDGDGIGDNADLDRDGDGISNAFEIQVGTDPNNPNSTPPDLDGDGIPDSLDSDRDGDSVNNDQDSYPDDATRTQLAAVQNLSTLIQGTQINVNWLALTDSIVQGYQLYRADFGQANWTLLNTASLLTTATYTDSNVINGQAYSYRVIAIDSKNNAGLTSNEVSQFVIYNTNTITTTQAQWLNFKAQINWTYTPATNETYKLYWLNTVNGTVSRTLILDGVATQYIDNASLWSQDQNYELVSVLSFTNPITAVTEQKEGETTTITLAALPAIEVTLANATATGVNSYQIEIQTGTQLSINGAYTNALNGVQLTLTTSQGSLNVTGNNGTFQFVARNAPAEVMTITLVESNAPADRGVTLTLNVTPDQTPLTVQLNGAGTSTSENSIVISGQVINADSGVGSLTANNNRYPGQAFGLTLLDNNTFTGELPLKTGDNLITVNAVGNLGQTAQASATIERVVSAIPSIEITSHQNNQVITTDRLNLQGRIYTSQDISQLQFFVNEQPVNVTQVVSQVYPFTQNDIVLNRGFNRIITRALTPLGSTETAIIIYYQDTTVDPAAPLELVMTTPVEQEVVNDTVLVIRGQLFNAGSDAGSDASLSINGTPTLLFGNADAGLLFSSSVSLTGIPEGPLSIDLVATSTGKASLSKTINVTIDNQAPVLTVNNALTAPPAVNEVREQPYRISGSVSDTNLSTLSINGQGLVLQPGIGNNYNFDTGIILESGLQSTVNITATDTAGNATSLSYEVLSNPLASLELIQPLPGTEYHTTGLTHGIEFITRITGTTAGDTLIVSAGTSQQIFPISQEIINGILTINTADIIDSLHFEVQNSAGQIQTSTDVEVKIINEDNIALALTKTNPARNEKDREPHTPIQFYFNKPVVLTDITISVKQSFHGTGYSNEIMPGAGLSDKYQGEVIDINKDQEVVPGGLSLLPGERIVEFYPTSDLSFGAEVFVNIQHQGIELTRFIYHVRPNPTYLRSGVLDQNQLPLNGITVSIPELGVSGVSDSRGSLVITGGKTNVTNIASGLYRMVANPDQINPAYGIVERLVRIENGILNKVPPFSIPALSPNVSYKQIQSGVINTLSSGDISIDTTQAILQFTDGRSSGNVHVQLVTISSNVYKPANIEISPLWMYNLQPSAIQVSGSVNITLRMPKLFGTMNYLPVDNSPVFIMGMNEQTLEIEPIGIGLLSNDVVTSSGELNMTRLDYIGIALVDKIHYERMRAVIAGDASLSQVVNEIVAQ